MTAAHAKHVRYMLGRYLGLLVLRCTQKLLRRVGEPLSDPPPSTTALGDWFAQPVSVGHQRFILLVSALSRMPVVMPARGAKNLPDTFPDALRDVLFALGVPPADVWRELQECRDCVIAPTNSRSVLGSANDFARMMEWRLPDKSDIDLVETAVWLGDTPVKPLGYAVTHDVARSLLAGE